MCVLFIDEKDIIENEKKSNMKSFIFLQKTKHFDKCHLSVLKSANRKIQESYSTSEFATEIHKELKK